jgi:hypothetical protein
MDGSVKVDHQDDSVYFIDLLWTWRIKCLLLTWGLNLYKR